MKKYLSFCVLVIVISCLCDTVEAKTKVVGNIFQSSRPGMEVKVSPEFAYLGHIEHRPQRYSSGGEMLRLKQYQDYHVFLIADAITIKKALVIQISKISGIHGGRYTGSLRDIQNKLDYGNTTICEKEWEYCTLHGRFSFPEPVFDYVKSKGYMTYEEVLLRVIYRLGKRKDVAVSFLYYESLSPGTKGGAVHDYLDQFQTNCTSCFDVLKCKF